MIRPARMDGKTWDKNSRDREKKETTMTYVLKFTKKGHSAST
jgi:hypothetical protein